MHRKLAKRGARWQPKEHYQYRQFRKGLYTTDKWQAFDILEKLLAADVFGDGVLREVMHTPKMKELLSRGYRNTDRIREAAGLVKRASRPKKPGRKFHLHAKLAGSSKRQNNYTVEEARRAISAQFLPNLKPSGSDPFAQELWKL